MTFKIGDKIVGTRKIIEELSHSYIHAHLVEALKQPSIVIGFYDGVRGRLVISNSPIYGEGLRMHEEDMELYRIKTLNDLVINETH